VAAAGRGVMTFCIECERVGPVLADGLCPACRAKQQRKLLYRRIGKGIRKWTWTFGAVTVVVIALKVLELGDVPRIVSIPLCLTLGSLVAQVLWHVWMEE
jgi:hypothetical protein